MMNVRCKNRVVSDETAFVKIKRESAFDVGSPWKSYIFRSKEALHVMWFKPNLNKQKEDVSIIISV